MKKLSPQKIEAIKKATLARKEACRLRRLEIAKAVVKAGGRK
jgi:hypothetical protein